MVSLAESAAFVAYEASSVASALAPWSAAMLASRLASCAATKALVARPSRAFAILVSTSSGVSNPSTVESREASALASALGVQGCRGNSVQEGCRYLRVHLRGSVHGRLQGVSSQGAGVCLGGLQPRDGGVSACELGGQRRPQKKVGHLGVHLQRRDPRRYV